MDIGKNLYDLRKKNGITQEMLAFEMGVSVAAVSKWENAIASPGGEAIKFTISAQSSL